MFSRWAKLLQIHHEAFLLLNRQRSLLKDSRIKQLSAPCNTTWTNNLFCFKCRKFYYHHWSSVFAIILFTCHALRRPTVAEAPVKAWQQTRTTPLRAILMSKVTANRKRSRGPDLAVLAQSLSLGVMDGLHHSHSQPQPKLITGLAGPVFIVGIVTAHAQFSISSSFMKRPLPQSSFRVRWKRNDVAWCLLCSSGNMPQTVAMFTVVCFFFSQSC